MRTYFYKILLPITLLIAGCKHDQAIKQLPAETQEGKNTFGCYLDNNLWLPENDKTCVLCQENLSATYNPSTGVVKILTFKYKFDGTYENLWLYAQNVNAAGDFNLAIDVDSQMTSYLRSYSNNSEDKYLLANQGNIHITKLDTINKIISGTFSFNAKNGNSTVAITKGVFDVKYH
jgi:hypothetical protein